MKNLILNCFLNHEKIIFFLIIRRMNSQSVKYDYLLLGANFLLCFSMLPLVYQSTITRTTYNIPYSTLIGLTIAFVVFLIVTFMKNYWLHVFIYGVGLISCIIIIMNKKIFDKNTVKEKSISKEIIIKKMYS